MKQADLVTKARALADRLETHPVAPKTLQTTLRAMAAALEAAKTEAPGANATALARGPRPVFGAVGSRDVDVVAAQAVWDASFQKDAELLALLSECAPHVHASAQAEHMLDGFRPQRRPLDGLAERLNKVLAGENPPPLEDGNAVARTAEFNTKYEAYRATLNES